MLCTIGMRAKKMNSVLFCPRDCRPCPCEPSLLIQSTKCNEVHFCGVWQCVLQWIVACWREPVLKFEDFWCPYKHFLQVETCNVQCCCTCCLYCNLLYLCLCLPCQHVAKGITWAGCPCPIHAPHLRFLLNAWLCARYKFSTYYYYVHLSVVH